MTIEPISVSSRSPNAGIEMNAQDALLGYPSSSPLPANHAHWELGISKLGWSTDLHGSTAQISVAESVFCYRSGNMHLSLSSVADSAAKVTI